MSLAVDAAGFSLLRFAFAAWRVGLEFQVFVNFLTVLLDCNASVFDFLSVRPFGWREVDVVRLPGQRRTAGVERRRGCLINAAAFVVESL